MYAKVFSQILDSSISENYLARHIFIDLLILANKHGEVDMTLSGIARRTNVPLDLVKRGISILMEPDPTSRTPAYGGRRLILLDEHRDWGWKIVNYRSYSEIQNDEGRRAYFREYKARKRAEKKASEKGEQKVTNVQDIPRTSGLSSHIDVDVKAFNYSLPAPTGRPSQTAGGNPKESRLRIVRGVDPSHLDTVKGLILRFWREMNGTECPWGSRDQAALGRMLRDNPAVTPEAWDRMLDNRARSIQAGEYTSSQSPCVWLKKLRSFESEPLNKHGDPLRSGRPDAMVGVMRK